MQEQLDDLEKEFTPLHNKEIEFNTKHKKRFIWAILSYIGYLILPTFIITFLLIALGPEDNGVFVTYTPGENAIESAMLDANALLILKESEFPDNADTQRFLYKIYSKDGYGFYINRFAGFLEAESNADNLTVSTDSYSFKDEAIDSILAGEKLKWANNANISFYIPEDDIPVFLNSTGLNTYLTENNLYTVEGLNVDSTFAEVFQLVLYLGFTVGMVFLLKPSFKYDFPGFKSIPWSETLGNVVIGVLLILGGNIASTIFTNLFNLITGTPEQISVNQLSIERSLTGPFWFVMVFIAVVLAPVVEELVFRKAFFSLFKKPTTALIVSSVCFGLIHVTTEILSGDFLLAFSTGVSYIIGGVVLGYVYIKNKQNIYINMLVHAGYNLFAMVISLLAVFGLQ